MAAMIKVTDHWPSGAVEEYLKSLEAVLHIKVARELPALKVPGKVYSGNGSRVQAIYQLLYRQAATAALIL